MDAAGAAYTSAGYNFLAFNNRGSAVVREAYRSRDLIYVGAALERFEDSVLDIDGAVEMSRRLGSKVIIQGHSHGCEKAMYWADMRRGALQGIILLSPSNSLELHRRYISPVTVDEQIDRLSVRLGDEEWMVLCGRSDYGIATGAAEYSIPTTAASLVMWLQHPYCRIFDAGWKGFDGRTVPAFAYVGGADGLQIEGPSAMASRLHQRFIDIEVVSPALGDHHFHGLEQAVFESVVSWLPSTGPV